jgi:hypothetical protein
MLPCRGLNQYGHCRFLSDLSLRAGVAGRVEANFADVDQLHTPVCRGGGMGAVEQLLFAEPDGLDPSRVDPERVDHRVPYGVRALLAEFEIGFAAADGIRVPDDQEAIALQIGVIERVRDQADGAERTRADVRGVEIELDGKRQLRESAELF